LTVLPTIGMKVFLSYLKGADLGFLENLIPLEVEPLYSSKLVTFLWLLVLPTILVVAILLAKALSPD